MFSNTLPKNIKKEVKDVFKSQLEIANKEARNYRFINYFSKYYTPEKIEKMIYKIVDEPVVVGGKEPKNKALYFLKQQIKHFNIEDIMISKQVKIGPKTADLVDYENSIIEIKSVDFRRRGAAGTTPFLLDYIYQVVEYLIVAEKQKLNYSPMFKIWLPKFNLCKEFWIPSNKYLMRWVKLYNK